MLLVLNVSLIGMRSTSYCIVWHFVQVCIYAFHYCWMKKKMFVAWEAAINSSGVLRRVRSVSWFGNLRFAEDLEKVSLGLDEA